MFVATGVGPFSGQAVHFRHFAPEQVPYAQARYSFEARRHYDILNAHLAQRRYLVGDGYTVDTAGDGLEEGSGLHRQKPVDPRRCVRDRPVLGRLRIEDAHRVAR